MSSGDIKEMLAGQFSGTTEAQWKRTSKKKVQTSRGPWYAREFTNAAAGLNVIAFSDEDDDETVILDAGTMLYHAEIQDMAEWGDEGEGVFVMFCPEAKWKRDHCIPDDHLEFILVSFYGVAEGFLEEASENQFLARSGLTLEDVKSHLEFVGMVACDMSLAGSLGEESDDDDEGDDVETHNGLVVRNRQVKRADAIAALNGLFDPDYMDEEDRQDYSSMTNEELLENVCLSGLVHDDDIDAVVD